MSSVVNINRLEGALLADYDALFADPLLCKWMSFVHADQNTELISCCQPFLAAKLQESGIEPALRAKMRGFVNRYFFDRQRYSKRLWYERLFSFEKFLVVMMTLESLNLRSMGGTPTVDDLPQALAWFGTCVTRARLDFPSIKERCQRQHQRMCQENKFMGLFTDISTIN